MNTRARTIGNFQLQRVLLFLVWPLMSLIFAIKSYKSSFSWIVVWMFIGFYGFTFTYVSDAFDADRIEQQFYDTKNMGFAEFVGFDGAFWEGNTQILQPTIMYLVSIFTDDTRFLFMALAMFFGFFYTKNIFLLRTMQARKKIPLGVLLFVLFAFTISIWEINGWRMWTASHVFFYSISQYFLTGSKKSIFWILLTPFIHFSFLIIIPITALFFLAKRLPLVFFFILFFICASIQQVQFDITQIAFELPSFLDSKVDSYGNEEYFENRSDHVLELNWYAAYYRSALTAFLLIFLILMFIKISNYKNRIEENVNHFLKFALFFSAISFLMASFTFADSGRFMRVAYLFLLLMIVVIQFYYPVLYKYFWVKPILIILGVFYLIVEWRVGLDRMSFATLLANPITAIFFEASEPIIISIKELLS